MKKCSRQKGSLTRVRNFVCSTCSGGGLSSAPEKKELCLGDGKLECVSKFCYLGDMIAGSGGAEEASIARVRCAWAKFRELSGILTRRGASLKLKGKIYRACVQSVLVYGSDTWAAKGEDTQRLQRTERMMMRWMCGVSLKDKFRSRDLVECLGICEVAEVVRRGRLRWFGHVERMNGDNWVSACRDIKMEGVRGRGRPKKTWQDCVSEDMKRLGLKREDAQDRALWRVKIMGNVLPALARKT